MFSLPFAERLALIERMPFTDGENICPWISLVTTAEKRRVTITAQEVLRRYAAGERDFRNASLRGANFKGQTLSGADFSGADIRSANFTNAVLHEVNFTNAQAGLQRRWMVMQLLLIAVIAGVAGILQAFSNSFTTFFWNDGSISGVISTIVYVLLMTVTYGAITLQGFTNLTFGSILTAFTVAVAGTIAGSGGGGAFPLAGAFAVASTLPGAVASAFAGAFASAGAFAVAVAFTFAFAVAGAFAFASGGEVASASAIAVAVAGLLLSLYVGWQALKENEKFTLVRLFGLALAALGGTAFCGADLTKATFCQACLKSTNFANSRQRHTTLTQVCWQQAQKLDRTRLGSAILQDRRVRILLTTPEKGYKQDFSDANLRGAYLKGVTLEEANLTRAILSEATLENATLTGAILTEAQAINTNFTGACFTGTTLQGWSIDSTTILKNIQCDYVFLLEKPNALGDRERRPHDVNKRFQPGDFEKFFKEVLDEVQILIRNGGDYTAFCAAMQNILEQNPDITQNAIKGIEKQGQDVVITLQVPEGTDKGKIERDWDSGYQIGLKAGRDIERLENAPKLEKLVFLLAEQRIKIENRNELMTGNNQSQNIDVKGDFTVTANQSVVSLRDISG